MAAKRTRSEKKRDKNWSEKDEAKFRSAVTGIQAILGTDESRVRREGIISRLLEDWWDEDPESYMELYGNGTVKGAQMLAQLEDKYPSLLDQLMHQNMIWIYRQYGV